MLIHCLFNGDFRPNCFFWPQAEISARTLNRLTFHRRLKFQPVGRSRYLGPWNGGCSLASQFREDSKVYGIPALAGALQHAARNLRRKCSGHSVLGVDVSLKHTQIVFIC